MKSRKSRKKAISILLVLALIFTLTPVSPFVADVDAVTDLDSLKSAISNAQSGEEILIENDITISESIDIGSKSIVLKGKGTVNINLSSKGGFTGENADLKLYNLQITSKGKDAIVFVDNGKGEAGHGVLRLEKCQIDSETLIISGNRRAEPLLYVYSGTVKTTATGGGLNICENVYFCPTGEINIQSAECDSRLFFIHQDGYNVTYYNINNDSDYKDDLSNINSSSDENPYEYSAKDVCFGNIQIKTEKIKPNVNAGGSKAGSVDYAWSYGGSVTPDGNGSFTVKPYQEGDVNYVIDSIVVDGVSQEITNRDGCTVTGVKSSIFVSFAYTVNFKDPANGTLSVSRDGKPLKSGDIVRGGEILEITCEGTTDDWECDTIYATGLKGNEENNFFIVTAQNGWDTPSITATMKPVKTVATPYFTDAEGTELENGETLKSDETRTVKIAGIEEGATVYYTTDGSDPKTSGTMYTNVSEITVSAGMTVKAVAVMADCNDSSVAEITYPAATEYYLSVSKNSEFRSVVSGYSVKVNNGDEIEKSSTLGYDYSNPGCNVYTGDTISFKPEIPDGYKLLRVYASGIGLKNKTSLSPDSDGWYSFTADDDIFKTGNLPQVVITVHAYPLIKVSVLPGIENGDVTTDWQEGYIGYTDEYDTHYITVNAIAHTGFAVSNVSYTYDNSKWINIICFNGKYIFQAEKDAVVKAEFVEGNNNETISTAEDFAAFAAKVNAGDTYAGRLVKLDADITLTGEWTPISNFEGVFDGQGHTISGLSIDTDADKGYFGLFGKAGDIKNLTVKGSIKCGGIKSDIGGGSYYIGGIAGEVANVTDCTSYVDITTGSAGSTGGIAGSLTSASGCINYGDITVDRNSINVEDQLANEWVGGIAGKVSGDVSNSANYGDISFDAGKYTTSNTGKGLAGVVFDGTNDSGGFGGIAGYAGGDFTNVANKGNITGDMRFAGGIVGDAGQHGKTLTCCYNTGAITSTGEYYPDLEIRLGGLVGSNSFCQSDLTLNNCYSTGKVTAEGTGDIAAEELHANEADRKRKSAKTDAVFALNNTYGSTAVSKMSTDELMTALNIGDSAGYAKDTTGINGGYPVLGWESGTKVSDTVYTVEIKTDPGDATVTVTDFKGSTVTPTDGKYSLKMGTYRYKVAKTGYLDSEGSITVTTKDKTVDITLLKKATVKFELDPADAVLTLTDEYGKTMTAKSGNTYELGIGGKYLYSAVKSGYTGTSGVVDVAGDQKVKITLNKESEATGGTIYGDGNTGQTNTISKGGTYKLGDKATGLVTVATSEAVTLVGAGTASSNRFDDLYIKCTQTGSTLTLENVYIDVQTGRTNVIDFTGTGNTLNFSGTNIIDLDTNAYGCAMVHVPKGTELTVTGGTAYLYKREQGAMFGGNGGAKGAEGQSTETNGNITIKDATIFAKNTKQGALFGAGAGAGPSSTPGSITIKNSELYLIANSRAAAIGGSAGSGGASPGADVTVSDSTITINVDWSGAAIGGGGYDGGNDAKGGNLTVSNSSIRTYIDANAVSSWKKQGVTAAGVNSNAAITASVKDASGNALYLAQIDTSGLLKTSVYTVKSGNTTVYSGGLHKYASVNENYEKDYQSRINHTPDNWYALNDSSLYIYLKGETQELTVNGARYKAEFDTSAGKFTVTKVVEAVTEVTVTKGDTVKVEAPVEVKTSGSTAKVTVTEKNTEEMVKQAKTNKADNISFTVTEDAAAKADKIDMTLDTKVVKDIAENTSAAVTISTPAGDMSFDKAALEQISKEAKGSTVEMSIEKVKEPDRASKELIGETGQIFSLNVKSGDKTISQFNGNVTLWLPIPAALKDKNIAAAHIESSRLNRVNGKTEGNKYRITVTHFSEYALVDADVVKLEEAADDDSAAKVKSLTKELKLKAATSLTSKRSVKVTAKVTKGSIKEITDLGYRVKYKYYRSEKKASRYKSVKTKTSKTYTNTKGSYGKKYYYKVRVYVYDEDGRLAASTALTQCRYGCRTWRK